jgi:hypothetical protein
MMVEQMENMPHATRRKIPIPRALLRILGITASAVLILYLSSYLLDEPLRSITEKKINRDLKGYSVRLAGLHVQLITLSFTLKGLTVRQQAYPDPPVAVFPSIKASIHWREIFSGKLFAEFRLDEPNLHINLQQLRNEAASTVSLKERGWQQAVEDIYPLKINSLKVYNASITYIDQDPGRPLVLSHLDLQASNIRNVHLPDKVYPSSFHMETAIFGTGHGSIDGRANFLAEPMPGVKARITLKKIPVDYFKPVIARSNLSISGGVLGASGDVEYAQKEKIAHLKDLTIQGMTIDYMHSDKTARAESRRASVAGKTARTLSNKPDVLISIDQLNLTGCNLGVVNNSAGKRYRVFLSNADFSLSNFSNQFSRGTARALLHGKFMGSGDTRVSGEFRPENRGPDLDLHIKIDTTQLVLMNDLLRAYGNFDVSAGTFSFVSELHVKNDRITGYIKPFFKDMKVYDRRKDKGKSITHQAYEIMISGFATLLENRQRQEVATKAYISGSLKKPETSTWQIVVELVKNAFFRAILPSFEKEGARERKTSQ